ncbi:protamine-like protein [Stegodyphus dumicola]|uniref:protamine-like protein n=1 Tax=Stegodyphus dumicola TaxID=202533 RepID=UPI0015A979BF|nr:protamine-like protein [Stegodyphus dumicola]
MNTSKNEVHSLKEAKGFSGMGAKNNAQPQTVLRRLLLNAIRKLQGRKGATLRDVKTYLHNNQKMDVKSNDAEIKLFMKSAVDRGILSKLDGHYKVMERGRRRRSSSRRRRVKSAGAPKSRRRRRRSSSPKKGRSRRRRSSGRRKSGRSSRRRRRKAAPADEA